MKKILAALLALAMVLSLGSALALDYKATLGNEATFETYTELRENAPAAMTGILRGTPAPHAVMDDYPGDTLYIYRSKDMYGYNAAIRINTTIAVFTDVSFESKDDAKASKAPPGCTAAPTCTPIPAPLPAWPPPSWCTPTLKSPPRTMPWPISRTWA